MIYKNYNNHKASRVCIIAEAGVNHNGNLDTAREMIRVAAESGADMVKFQSFRADKVVSRTAAKADYQLKTTGKDQSQYEMLKALELSAKDHRTLINCCQEHKVDFLSTAFDHESIELLVDMGLETWKIPSGEITNLPYLRKIGRLGKKSILSTGMADLGEIEDALEVLEQAGTPWENITVLHCNTEYPTPMQDVNLRAMQTIKTAFPGIKVGYSDHTLGIEIPIAAVAMGATVIEKHFTLDRDMEGPDHRASLEPGELRDMVKAIRNIEQAMGDGVKRPSPSESKNRDAVRKRIVASRDIASNELFSEDNITVKRAEAGLSPMFWDQLRGRKATRVYKKDESIEL